MLAYRDASMGLDARREDPSSYNDQALNAQYQRQHDLDELETSKTRRCLKKTTQFLFSHIGLVGLVVVYAVAGGFLFQLLEIRQERYNCQEAQGEQIAQITYIKQQIIAYIQQNTTSSTGNSTNGKDNTTVAFAKIGSILYQYRQFVINATTKYRFYGDDCSVINKWTYPNSLLFAITIITTIGYGNITPVTWEGQLCCICYATIGIPIFLLCVANISGVLGEMFRFLYGKIICGPCSFIKKRRALARKERLEEESGINTDRVHPSGWTLDNDDKKTSLKRASNPMAAVDELDEEENRRYQRVAVPLTVTMVIIAAYIWIGSALFHSFEGWTMIQAGYFCFITLSTIGFGDFVPGQRKDDPHASEKLILGAIYVLFGMAILAMCFDLMQEEIVAKFCWIGTKIGIVEKDDNNNNIQTDKLSEAKNKRSPSTASSMHDPNTIKNPNYGNDLPRPSSSNSTRKTSPRNNTARVHPVDPNASSEATLHQRIAATKPY